MLNCTWIKKSVCEMRGQRLGKAIQVYNLCYSNILHNSTFTWKQGERIALMGANGSGKSTLAKILAGRLQCSSGRLMVTHGNLKPLWQEVGLIGQHPRSQVIGATVGEELAFSLVNRGYRPETVQDRINETLISLGLEGKEHKSPSDLSGGERQRLIAAAVILAYCPFLVLDESLSMLDLNAQRKTYEYISRHAEESGQLWITHDPELAMMQDRLILIKDGRIFEEGSPGEVLSDEKLCSSYGILSLKGNDKASKQTYGQLTENASDKSNDRYSHQSKDKPIIIWKDVAFDPGIHLNAKVNHHDFIAVVGPSGSGKTTLLESIIGWRKPTQGKIEISEGMTVSLLLQEAGEYLIGSTVYNEVFYLELLKLGRLHSEENSQQMSYLKNENYLKDFKLEGLAKTPPEYLSGGQRQTIALASALRNQPSILLLDEPLLGLDRLKREETLARIKQVRGNYPITILYVTHNLGEILELANRIWLMKDGEIILDCQADMWENYSNLWDQAGVKVPSKSAFAEADSFQARETVNKTLKKINTAYEKHIEQEQEQVQVLETIDPRLKLLTLLTVSLMLGFSGFNGLLLSSGIVLGLIIITPRIIISWRSMGYVLAGLAVLYAILLGWEGYSGLRIWEGHFNSHGLQEAGYMTWKISLIFSLSLLLISTTDYVEQGIAINWVLAPILKRTKSGDFALLLMLTLRFISFFKEEAKQLWKARAIKGPLAPSLRGRVKEISYLALPLFKLTLKRAEEVSENLLGRGYNPINYRIHSHWRWQQRDNYSFLIIMGWILFLGLFLLSD